jgi:hypothetical protein
VARDRPRLGAFNGLATRSNEITKHFGAPI